MGRWERHPDFHVYHFAPYEPAALKRLMGRHATREEELDRLLRGRRFVDLHAVVRQGLRVGVEAYGLKQLEAVHGFTRELELRTASLHKHALERALELADAAGVRPEDRKAVEAYNRDDCLSTWRLRDWLEQVRAERIAAGEALPRPEPGEDKPSEALDERTQRIRALMERLAGDVPRRARRAQRRAARALAPREPPRVAPPRGQGLLVGVLPSGRARARGPPRREARARGPRAREERRRHGQGARASLPLPGAGPRRAARPDAPRRRRRRRSAPSKPSTSARARWT